MYRLQSEPGTSTCDCISYLSCCWDNRSDEINLKKERFILVRSPGRGSAGSLGRIFLPQGHELDTRDRSAQRFVSILALNPVTWKGSTITMTVCGEEEVIQPKLSCLGGP